MVALVAKIFAYSKSSNIYVFKICIINFDFDNGIGLDYDRIIIELNLEWVHIN